MPRRETDREPTAKSAQSLVSRTFAALGRIVRLLLLSLCISILIEWIGMHWWWPEQGIAHSRNMLQDELAYLKTHVSDSLISRQPTRFAASAASNTRFLLLERSGLLTGLEMITPSDHELLTWSPTTRRLYQRVMLHAQAAVNILQVFCARLAVLILALPLILMTALVGLVDGLVKRDLRRWGGGRESSYLYHYAKRLNAGLLIGAWVLYLAIPVSVPPPLIILPFAILIAMTISVTASMFKKYL